MPYSFLHGDYELFPTEIIIAPFCLICNMNSKKCALFFAIFTFLVIQKSEMVIIFIVIV